MEKYNVKTISNGIAIGKIRYYDEEKLNISKFLIEDICAEVNRFNAARIKAKDELKEIYKEAVLSVGKEMAEIFEVCQLILLDEEYVNNIKNKITTEKVNSEYAIHCVAKEFSERLKNSDNIYLSDRVADIIDVSNRIIRILNEQTYSANDYEGEIVVLDEITPSEILRMGKASAVVTKSASYMSHASIMSRNMGLVHVTGLENLTSFSGKMAIIDTEKGVIYIEPDDVTMEYYSSAKEDEIELIEYSPVNDLGKVIQVMANVNSYEEAKNAYKNHSDGIGLFRTEFIYMNRDRMPTEDEQFDIYKSVVELFEGKPVTIRTLDMGADKKVEYLNFANEKNPALGCRGIRYSLKNKEILLSQLKAIYRASAYGDIKVMFPLITSSQEISDIKSVINEVKKELEKTNTKYGDVEIGVMIETPAAAMISDVLAKEVDFFSIGTNDLAQYSLAIDRENEEVFEFYNPYHKGVMRMIEITIENAHKENCKVGICGEMASDASMTKKLSDMGVDSLSVSPVMVQGIKRNIILLKMNEKI